MQLTYVAAGLLALACAGGALADERPLPPLNLDLSQTTVSGISSGAFMAVQFAVAHSATVRGVAATAGGPYACAGRDAWAGAGVGKAIARCMQGDPAYPAQPLGDAELATISAAARDWSAKGLIDDLANLQRQRVWLFHGYNDGIVKKPVAEALRRWYAGFVPAAGLFYKDQLKAGHAQVSASCSGDAGCQPCATSGGDFINACADVPAEAAYDAAGAALQFFYGPLTRTDAAALGGTLQRFDQRPYIRRDGAVVDPLKVSLAASGYLYLPAACAAGEACRLHVAFHGCRQQAEAIGSRFVEHAGYNEWADANRIVVLYPQTAATTAVPLTPYNPQGCWDWWGYNDFSFDMTGHYATRDGVQIAAVHRMIERLASGGAATVAATPGTAPPAPQLIDASSTQVVLAWNPVAGAEAYAIERDGRELARIQAEGAASWADSGLKPSSSYRYVVRAVAAGGHPGPASAVLVASTSKAPPFCDPYYSLAQNRPVNRYNLPTTKTCP